MTYTLSIKGMHCSSCANAVEKNLKNISQIKDVSVHVLQERAIVHSNSLIPQETFKHAIQEAGYSLVATYHDNNEEIVTINKSSQEQKNNNEKKKVLSHLCIAWFSFIVIMLLMFFSNSLFPTLSSLVKDLLLFTISLAVTGVIGRDIFSSAFKALRQGNSNMDTLTSIGVSMSLLSGLLALIRYIDTSIAEVLYIQNFSGLAAMILTLAISGSSIETFLRKKSIGTQQALINLLPRFSTLVTFSDSSKKQYEKTAVATQSLKIHDSVFIAAGEQIPCDGVVIMGESTVNESMITGESLPIEKQVGATVIGGTINHQGQLIVEVTQDGNNSTLRNILKTIEQAQSTKPKIQLLVDKVTALFVPCIIVLALISFFAWLIFPNQLLHSILVLFQYTWKFGSSTIASFIALPLPLNDEFIQQFALNTIQNPMDYLEISRLSLAVYASISVLVVACPCALGLATPATISVGIAKASSFGIFFRSAEIIERLKNINCIALDKTGTLTEGNISLNKIYNVAEIDKVELIRIAAMLEQGSEHPLAKAVMKRYHEIHSSPLTFADTFQSHAGKGISANIENTQYFFGKPSFITEMLNKHAKQSTGTITAITKDLQDIITNEASKGHSISMIANTNKILGIFTFSDTIRPSSKKAIQYFRANGIKTVIVSGDNKWATQYIASYLDIQDTYSEMSPQEKYHALLELQKEYKVLMIGDGINDAPALLQADVGVAMGGGTDTAKEAGDIILFRENIEDLVHTIRFATHTNTVLAQNLFWAFFYNVLMLPLAMLGMISPIFAEIAMALSSISVLLNANRLWMIKKDPRIL